MRHIVGFNQIFVYRYYYLSVFFYNLFKEVKTYTVC